jgi:3-hydroxybutyryl-CoA dehydrogenase
MRPYYVTAQSMVGRPAGFAFIDEACRGLGGVPMGPFELMDLIGLDTNLAITRAIFEALGRPTRFTPPQLQTTLVERGALGRKSRRGFYQYTEGKPSGENADAVALLPTLPPCSREEVWDRLRGALTAEALMLVAEGGASRGDVDTAIKLAMNFPQGPLQWQNANPAEKSA